MTETKTLWLAGALILSFGGNIAILQLTLNDKLDHPVRVGAGLNIIYMLIVGGGLISLDALPHATIAILVSLVFMAIIIGQSSWRDRRGIKFGERFIESMHEIDLATNYSLSMLSQGNAAGSPEPAIRDTLSHILTHIAKMLRLHPERDDSHLSILLAKRGRFLVLAQQGIKPERIPLIEAKFGYGDNSVGIAGKALTERRTILISDLSKSKEAEANDWVQVDKAEAKKGSIICVPIFRGVGIGERRQPFAVLSVTSLRRNAFDKRVVPNILRRVSAKVEALIYILDISSTISGR